MSFLSKFLNFNKITFPTDEGGVKNIRTTEIHENAAMVLSVVLNQEEDHYEISFACESAIADNIINYLRHIKTPYWYTHMSMLPSSDELVTGYSVIIPKPKTFIARETMAVVLNILTLRLTLTTGINSLVVLAGMSYVDELLEAGSSTPNLDELYKGKDALFVNLIQYRYANGHVFCNQFRQQMSKEDLITYIEHQSWVNKTRPLSFTIYTCDSESVSVHVFE